MTNSRQKGKRGELEWAQELRRLGFRHARRGQQFKGGPDSPDVVDGIPYTHCEVKRVEKLNIHTAVNKAVVTAGDGDVPYVAHRRNQERWLVTVRAEDLLDFAMRVLCYYPNTLRHLEYPGPSPYEQDS